MALFSNWKRDREAKAHEMRGLLMAARRYVESYAENDDNHPQACALARSLVTEIDTTLNG